MMLICPPGLHITLGIFYRLFQLLEDECHVLDVAVRDEEDSCDKGGPSYSNYVGDVTRARILKDEIDRANEQIDQLNDLIAIFVLFGEDEELQALRSELEEIATKVNKLDTEWTKANALTTKLFKREDGPFVKALDIALDGFNVRRQAYYGGTFVGNHVHLKPENTVTLCNAVFTAGHYRPAIMQRAERIHRKYSVVFALFHNCDELYNKPYSITDKEIALLGTHISTFMSFYREQFPDASVIPKVHMLETHVVDWLNEWRVGLGLMGEQGAESIHAYFNNIKASSRMV
ncbi:uncharacterized protein LOC135345702 [Halichondria panicea]|uniref:uncharacterized protein LOC135345702 n=1 Tax=Halichondria panicea TaxID=6063 RepID=UPI00312BAD18